MLTLAVQKDGRLSEPTVKLLKDCGIEFTNGKSSALKTTAQNFPLEILFLRDDDIPKCVEDNIADAGIVGQNVVQEKNCEIDLNEKLGFAKCRLSIAVPKQFNYNSLGDLNGIRIGTSFPNILKNYLDEHNIDASIRKINGSVEISTGINLADAIFDIVSTGSTLLSNGLREVQKVIDSEAVLVSHKDLSETEKEILDELLFRIRSVKKAGHFKYLLLNSPNESIEKISNILPGMKSPTVMPLAIEGWSSVHTVIKEDEFWKIIKKLKDAGAQGILVIPIEKMII